VAKGVIRIGRLLRCLVGGVRNIVYLRRSGVLGGLVEGERVPQDGHDSTYCFPPALLANQNAVDYRLT